MKYLVILFILFPMLVSGATSYTDPKCNNKCKDGQCVASTEDGKYYCVSAKPGPDPSLGYATKDCDKKCTKNQKCTLSPDDERYFCNNVKDSSDKTPKQLEVYISCKTIGGIFKSKCSSNEIAVSSISGKTEIPIREYKPGQCCILKSKLKVH